MWRVESAKVERPFPGKDHDRIFVDPERNIFGVFDGAANPFASELAIDSLGEFLKSSRIFDVVAALRKIQTDILNEFQGAYLTTGSLVHLRADQDLLAFTFAAAGDSPIFRYDHAGKTLYKETEDEGERGEGFVDASNFLGSPEHTLSQAGVVPLFGDTSLAIVSDGITDTGFEGHVDTATIGRIIGSADTPGAAAESIMKSAAEFDDASAVVVKAHQV